MSAYHDEDEEYERQHIPRMRLPKPSDGLTPRPPKGWLIALWYPPLGEGYGTLDLGIWVYLVTMCQQMLPGSRDHYMICRDARGTRALVVSPAVAGELDAECEGIDSAIEGSGADCIEPYIQDRAGVLLARRIWRRLSLDQRIELAGTVDCEVDMADLLGDEPLRDLQPGYSGHNEVTWTLVMEYAS